jgi:Zn-dependent peptidase ImmA (M78 family)
MLPCCDISSVLFRDADRIVIGINARHASTRQRFTIAHECGHLLLHTGRDLYIDRGFIVRSRDTTSAEVTNVEEIEANAFAAEI